MLHVLHEPILRLASAPAVCRIDNPRLEAFVLCFKEAAHLFPPSFSCSFISCLQLYHSGVVGDDACCQDLNHGVLAVGYDDGSKGGTPHYVIKVQRGRRE